MSEGSEVEMGQSVSIAPLLKILELDLRDKTLKATQQFRPKGNLIPTNYPPGENNAETVNQFFRANGTTNTVDCLRAIYLIHARAIILNVGNDNFNDLGLSFMKILVTTGNAAPGYPIIDKALDEIIENEKKVYDEKDLDKGDLGYIKNFAAFREHFKGYAAQGENVIALGSNDGNGKRLFWGYYDKPKTLTQAEFVALLKEPGIDIFRDQKPEVPIPNFNDPNTVVGGLFGKAWFIDVASLAEMMFKPSE